MTRMQKDFLNMNFVGETFIERKTVWMALNLVYNKIDTV